MFIFAYICGSLLAVWATVVIYYKYVYCKYWERSGLPYIPPRISLKVIANPSKSKKSVGEIFKELYNKLKKQGYRHGGVYVSLLRLYLPIDPDIMGNILVKDFHCFEERGLFCNEDIDPLWSNLLVQKASKWRVLRSKLSPAFRPRKIKDMASHLLDCTNALLKVIETDMSEARSLNIKQIMCYFAIDVIASCAFGLECNSINNPNSEFVKHGLSFLRDTADRGIKNLMGVAIPTLAKLLKFRFISEEDTAFFLSVVEDTVDYRKKNNYRRDDFLQQLIDIQATDNDGMTIKEIAAQVFIFFVAGFESVATTMTFCLYELALNQEIQEELRTEICNVLANYDGNVTHESLLSMKYMQQVIDETLRKYPVGPVTLRKCVKDYEVPDTGVVIEKGTTIAICIFGVHRDPEYYPEPDKFDPQRFSIKNKSKIRPFTYMPFGEGPRNCLGLRFATIEMKTCLTMLLKNYRFFLDEATQVPVNFCPRSVLLSPAHSVLLKVDKTY